MDEPSRGQSTTQGSSGWRQFVGPTNAASARMCEIPRSSAIESCKTNIDETDDDDSTNSSLDANEILLQLNEDPCCNGSSGSGESCCEDGTTSADTVHPKLEESDAKRQIELIFRTPACWRSETDQTHLLYLLQRFPSLAAQNFDWDYNLFWQHGSEWSSPLCFLLASGANLETIQAVYYLYPETLSKPQGVHRDLPFHFACRFGVTEDVLVFLIQKFPYAVMVSNSNSMLPIHCALGKKDVFPYGSFRHASLETVKMLVEIYPQSLLKQEQEYFYTPLQIAFAHKYSPEVVEYIMSKLPERMESFHLKAGCYHNKRFSVDFDLARSMLVSNLLPRLERFNCEPTHWTMEGWLQLLRCMQQNTSVKHFQAMNLPSTFFVEEASITAISTLLQRNNNLEHLGLSLRSEEYNTDTTSVVRCLQAGLERNQSLQSLELDNFSVTCAGLNQFLSSDHAPSTVKMTNPTLLPVPGENNQQIRLGGDSTSKVQHIVLSNCSLLPTAEDTTYHPFNSLLHGIATLPQLKELTLDTPRQQKSLDVTDPIVHLLQSESLGALKIRGLGAQIQPVCKSLQSNMALVRLDFPALLGTQENRRLLADTLENHNARISFVQLPAQTKRPKEEDETKKIRYLTQLNKFGRGRLRESNTTKALVVKLLRDFALRSRKLQPSERLSVQLGLLRESPSLWCHSACVEEKDSNRRRRKRQRVV